MLDISIHCHVQQKKKMKNSSSRLKSFWNGGNGKATTNMGGRSEKKCQQLEPSAWGKIENLFLTTFELWWWLFHFAVVASLRQTLRRSFNHFERKKRSCMICCVSCFECFSVRRKVFCCNWKWFRTQCSASAWCSVAKSLNLWQDATG